MLGGRVAPGTLAKLAGSGVSDPPLFDNCIGRKRDVGGVVGTRLRLDFSFAGLGLFSARAVGGLRLCGDGSG